MSFDVAAELKAKIAKENDEDRRTTLMLLLGVFEATSTGIDKISKKIDALMSDEERLRDAVLNGHAEHHDRDHNFLADLYRYRDEAAKERTWVRERMAADCQAACEWAKGKMSEEVDAEKTAAEDAKADKRAARDAVIRTVVAALVSSVMSALAVLAYMK